MKRLFGKRALLMLGLLVLVGGGGFGAARVLDLSLPFGPPKSATANATKTADSPPVGTAYPTRERIVNLADGGILRYLKTTIVLELADPSIQTPPKGEEYKKRQDELAKELRGQNAVIDDQITSILTAKNSSDLMTPEGKQHLKEELKARLNKVIGEERILAVYFTDFIIQ